MKIEVARCDRYQYGYKLIPVIDGVVTSNIIKPNRIPVCSINKQRQKFPDKTRGFYRHKWSGKLRWEIIEVQEDHFEQMEEHIRGITELWKLSQLANGTD